MKKTPTPAPTGEHAGDDAGLGDVLQFMRLLWSIDHRLQSASKRMASHLGVTGPQRLVVRFVGLFPGVTSGRLSELLHLHPSTLTGVVQRLRQRGLLVRGADPADGRRALLRLTAAGRRLAGRKGPTVETAASRALARCSAAERASARALLEAIAAELDALSDQERPSLRREGAAAGRARRRR